MSDVHVYVTRPAAKEGTTFEDIEEALGKLDFVSDVTARPAENLVAVTFEGGRTEQEEIKKAIEDSGYEVSRLSVRSDIGEEFNLWDI